MLGFRPRYILREDGWSAKSLERPLIRRVFDLVEDGKIDVIVVWKLDRLVRSLRDLMNTHAFLEKHRVRLHSVTEQFDTASSFGRFNFRNVASAAELERDLIAERSRLGRMSQAINCRWPTQRPPLGYRLLADRELAIDEDEAALVRSIFASYVRGVALTEISRRLGETSALTRLGRTFSPGAVHAVVRNEIYTGKVTILGIEHDRPKLRIVDKKIWAAAEARRGKRAANARAASAREVAADSVFQDYFAYLSELPSPELAEPPVTPAWRVGGGLRERVSSSTRAL